MSKNIECEERAMIDESTYLRLLNHYLAHPHQTSLILDNYYFDDQDLNLRKHGMMLRIRVINDREYELCLKIKGHDGDTELNQIVTKEEKEELINSNTLPKSEAKKKVLEITPHVSLLAHLRTIRLEVKENDHLLVIDQNNYYDVTDYDIEVEANNMELAKKYIHYYCEKYDIKYLENYQSKSRRAINYKLNH